MEDSVPEVEVRTEDCSSPTEVGLIMATMPNPEARGYFGPRRSRPATIPGTRAPRRRAISASPLTVGAGGATCWCTVLRGEGARVRKGEVGRENDSDLVLALPRDRNADKVSIEHRTIRELHGSVVGAIT
jgi:hypothetical protein